MKISHFIGLCCLPLALTGVSYHKSNYVHAQVKTSIVAQSRNVDNSAEIQAYAEKIINLFFSKEFEAVNQSVHPDLREDVSTTRIEGVWATTQAENGTFQKIVKSNVIQTPGSDLVILTLEFDKVTEDWIMIFNDQGEVVGVDFPTSQDIETISRKFIDALVTNDFSQARIYLHPFLKQDLFPQQIQQKWQALTATKGNFQEIKSIKTRQGSSIDDTDIVELDLELGKSDAEMIIIFDSSKSIIGVSLVE